MELVALVIIWPFLIFAIGMILIAFTVSPHVYLGFGFMSMIFWILLGLIVFLGLASHSRKNLARLNTIQQLALFRSWVITFSLELILPVLIKYIVDALDHSLFSIALGVVIGFAIILWGMFTKVNNTVMYGNIFGGALILLYVYFQLGGLGEFARIVVAAMSLAFAIFIAIIKFKDKLT